MPNFLWKSRHSLYYFRRRIPTRYSTYFDGRAELRHSLNTPDRLIAKRRARSLAAKIDQCFEWLDQMARKNNPPGTFRDDFQIFITTESTATGTKTTRTLDMSVEEHEKLGDEKVSQIISSMSPRHAGYNLSFALTATLSPVQAGFVKLQGHHATPVTIAIRAH